MSAYTSLKNHFLIAMPNLADPNFARSVTYICEHTPEGAMGIIINFPMSVHLRDILENMNIPSKIDSVNNQIILAGGPLQQERGFVIHRDDGSHWESSIDLSPEVTVTTSKDILHAISKNKGPEDHLVALGYAGWGQGQLEKEIAENSWICCPVNLDILFKTPPEKIWHEAAKLVGVDIEHISTEIGHA